MPKEYEEITINVQVEHSRLSIIPPSRLLYEDKKHGIRIFATEFTHTLLAVRGRDVYVLKPEAFASWLKGSDS